MRRSLSSSDFGRFPMLSNNPTPIRASDYYFFCQELLTECSLVCILISRRKRHDPLVLGLAISVADNPERFLTHRLTVKERIDLGICHAM